MLRSLHMKDVGPAPRFDLELGERLNVLTGDNGLGKSFVLDVAWWALTGTWTGRAVLPRAGREDEATISGESVTPEGRDLKFESKFVRIIQDWEDRFRDRQGTFTLPHMGVEAPAWLDEQFPVLYVRADAGFSVWDPTRNHRTPTRRPFYIQVTPEPYRFDAKELWDGLNVQDKPICNGLIRDWNIWQLEAGSDESNPFDLLARALSKLSHPLEEMKPGKLPLRLYLAIWTTFVSFQR
jgi:hypothetical protein